MESIQTTNICCRLSSAIDLTRFGCGLFCPCNQIFDGLLCFVSNDGLPSNEPFVVCSITSVLHWAIVFDWGTGIDVAFMLCVIFSLGKNMFLNWNYQSVEKLISLKNKWILSAVMIADKTINKYHFLFWWNLIILRRDGKLIVFVLNYSFFSSHFSESLIYIVLIRMKNEQKQKK